MSKFPLWIGVPVAWIVLGTACSLSSLSALRTLAARFEREAPRRSARTGTIPTLRAIRETPSRLVLTGQVASEETRQRIRGRTAQLYGPDGFVDTLTVASDGQNDDAASLHTMLTALPLARRVSVSARGRAITLSGAVDSDEARQKLLKYAQDGLGPDGTVGDALKIVAPTPEPAATPRPTPVPPPLVPVSGARVSFGPGNAVLTAEGQRALDAVARSMNATTDRFEIASFTDNTGKPAANVALSQRRADAVRAYLIQRGVGPARLVARGYGDAQPLASNQTLDGRRRNRRIELRRIGE